MTRRLYYAIIAGILIWGAIALRLEVGRFRRQQRQGQPRATMGLLGGPQP